MRCTSSDLIMGCPRACLRSSGGDITERRGTLRRSIRARRVPKRQQTVKVEPFDRLDAAPIVDSAGEHGKPRRVERRRGHRMQEWQIAEAAVQLIVTDRQL